MLFSSCTILWLILWGAQHLKAAEAGHRVPGGEGVDPFNIYLWHFQMHNRVKTLHKTKEWNIDKAFLNKVWQEETWGFHLTMKQILAFRACAFHKSMLCIMSNDNRKLVVYRLQEDSSGKVNGEVKKWLEAKWAFLASFLFWAERKGHQIA